MNTKIETKVIKVKDIKPNPKNPKKHWVEKISESMNEMGYVEPIVVDENDMILAGHGRLKALKENRVKEIGVIVKSGLTQEQKEKYLLLSNKIVEAGGWNEDLLKAFDEELLIDVGFDDEEIDELFGLETVESFDIQKELAKIHARGQQRVKEGDIWQLGNHRLLVGDSTKRENWERLLGNKKFDFLFSDPPYRIVYGKTLRKVKTKDGYVLQGRRTYESIGKTIKGFGANGNRIYEGVEKAGGVPEYDEWLSIANEFQNPKGANVMLFEYWKNTPELWHAIEKYWKIKNMIIWHAVNRHQGFGGKSFFNKFDIAPLAGEGVLNEEYEAEFDQYLKDKGQKLLDTYDVLLFGSRRDATWSKKKGGKTWLMTDHVTHPVANAKETTTDLIFGAKAISILLPYVKVLSPRGGIVMEPFAGSFSTGIACEIMKRRCFAIEYSETYTEVCLARWEKFTGKKAIKVDEVKPNQSTKL